MKRFAKILKLTITAFALSWIFVPDFFLVFAQDPAVPSSEEQPREGAKITYGAESEFSSAYVWRGLVVSDRPIDTNAGWISVAGLTFIAADTLALSNTTEGTRPRVTDLILTYERGWKKFKIEPTFDTYWYRDPLSIPASRSMEGSLRVSYPLGPTRLFTTHSVDVLTHKGAYFGEAGVEYEHHFSKKSELAVTLDTGWASSSFNHAYIGVNKPAFNLADLECSFTRYIKPHLYLRPRFEFSSIVDHQLRASLSHPDFFTFGLAIGVEF